MTLSFCSEQPEEQNGGRNARQRSKLESENKNVNFILHIHFEMTIRHPKILCHQMEKSAGMSGGGSGRKKYFRIISIQILPKLNETIRRGEGA